MCQALQRAVAIPLHAGYGTAITKVVRPCELTFLTFVLADRNEPAMEVADVLKISLL